MMGEKVQPMSTMRGGHYGHHHHYRQFFPRHRVNDSKRPSTLKTKYFTFISSLRKSIQKCHRRLVEFFFKLDGARRIGQGFVIHHREDAGSSGFQTPYRPRLQLEFEANSYLTSVLVSRQSNRNQLPPLVCDKTKTIVLDLDETLVHSSPTPPPEMYDFMIKPNIFGLEMNYVLKRPGVDEFLEAISKKYEVVVFTAGLEPYASLLLNVLDPKGLISHRLYRDSCKQIDRGKFIKDLSTMGRDLGKVVIVDDNPKLYSLQPANGIPIKRFEDDMEDTELKKLTQFFQRYCDDFKDMRDAVKQYYGGDKTKQPRSSSKTSQ